MKSSFLVVALALCILLPSTDSGAQQSTRADRPPVKVGDSWVMEISDGRTGNKLPDLVLTIKEVSADNFIAESDTDRRTYTRDWNLVEIKTGNTVAVSAKPSRAVLQFPLEVGKKWESEWDLIGTRVTTRWRARMHVEGVETVTVPAGTFQAFRIKWEGTFNRAVPGFGNVTGSRKETLWYSPDAKRAVKSEWEERAGNSYNVEKSELRSLNLAQ